MLDLRVLETMDPWLRAEYGNPSSRSHQHGWKAEEAVEQARVQVADLVGAQSSEIVFTSGATESNNMVLKGLGRAIVTTAIEHKSVLAPCAWVAANFARRVSFVDVDHTGTVEPIDLFSLVSSDNDLVSVMLANNEVGSIQPVANIVRLLSGGNVLVHSDVAQAVGKMPLNFETLGIHFASFSAHKMYGPKGIGALYIRKDVSHLLVPLIHGGGQERGFRSGTLNVPAIVGFGKTCEIAKAELAVESLRITYLRNRLEELLKTTIPEVTVHGGANRLAGNLSFSIPCRDMNAFMAFAAEYVSLSLGSACMSNSGRSHVLQAMGVDEDEARRTIRIGVGRFNTEEEIVEVANIIASALDKVNDGG